MRQKIIALLALVCFSSSGVAADRYRIDVELLHQGTVFASPWLEVESHQPATLEVDGPHAYRLDLEAAPQPDDRIQLALSLVSAHGNFAPTMQLRIGERGSISVGELQIQVRATPIS